MDLMRLATAGSVDDGKSTLIGRLLYDTGSVFDDQLQATTAASQRMGSDEVNLALLTDGLRAEREQGITIDVAFRYFSTERRAFIIADTPGHVQYTRNMVTGASTADLAIVLVDARSGLTEQSRRHAFLCSLLGVRHLVVAVNKMDLVDYDAEVYRRISDSFRDFSGRLQIADTAVIPMSALRGDNVVQPTTEMPWYSGPPLLYHLENVHLASDQNLVDVRLPVQCVIRPHGDDRHHDYRGYAGQLAGGVLRVGDEVTVLPGGLTTRVIGIDAPDGAVDEAFAPMSVTVRLADDLDVSRGDMIVRTGNQPSVTQDLDAIVCHMDREPIGRGSRMLLKHANNLVPAIVDDVRYRIDVNTLHRCDADKLGFNEIGRVRVRTTRPVMCDSYRRNRTTGNFVLIDPHTKRTVSAGIVEDR
jgi:bifunctional enzyme CysN/CysC